MRQLRHAGWLRWGFIGLWVCASSLSPVACHGPETADGAGGQSGDEARDRPARAAVRQQRSCIAPVSLLLPDWVFENFLFRPLPGRWFEADHWHGFVTGLSIALSLGSSALWMLEQRARRLGQPSRSAPRAASASR